MTPSPGGRILLPRVIAAIDPVLHLHVREEDVHSILEHGLTPPATSQFIVLTSRPSACLQGLVRLKVDAKQARADGITFSGEGDQVLTRGWAGFLPAKYLSYLNLLEPIEPH